MYTICRSFNNFIYSIATINPLYVTFVDHLVEKIHVAVIYASSSRKPNPAHLTRHVHPFYLHTGRL